MQSRTVDLWGPVHFVDFGGRGPTIVCVHGLGGSHVNWVAAGPRLAQCARVLAVDLPGFGRTPLAGRRTGIPANRRLLDRFLAQVVGEPAILMGHSMGGTIAILEASRQPAWVAGLILAGPSVPKPSGIALDREVARYVAAYAIPGLSSSIMRRRRRRLGPEGLLRESLRLACVDPGLIPRDALDVMVDSAYERNRMPWADRAYLEAARSLANLHTRGRRRFFEAVQRVEAPTLLVQGAGDRLALLVSARQIARLRPDWAFTVLDRIGHLPMLEDPGRFVSAIDVWLGDLARPAAGRAHEVA